MNRNAALVLVAAIGVVVGGVINHTYSSQVAVAAGLYSSTAEAPLTISNTAVGAAAGGIAAWLAGLAGLFDKIMAIIGIGQKIKDAVPKSLIDAVSQMIKERKINLSQLLAEFKQIDPVLIMSLIKELVSLIGGKLNSGPVDPALMKSGDNEPIIIEIV